MGRGKPFSQSVNRLIAAGVVPRPVWLSSVEATRPKFEPVKLTTPPHITYPEDRLRAIFLQRNPDARRIPVNLKAETVEQRHIADKFVSIQMELMEKKGMPEEEAYNAAESILSSEQSWQTGDSQMGGSLANSDVSNEITRLYLASLKDSQRDIALHRALVKHNNSNNNS